MPIEVEVVSKDLTPVTAGSPLNSGFLGSDLVWERILAEGKSPQTQIYGLFVI